MNSTTFMKYRTQLIYCAEKKFQSKTNRERGTLRLDAGPNPINNLHQ